VRTGEYLDHLTDGLEEFGSGSFIEEFLLGGHKSMRFLFSAPRQENVQPNAR